MQQSSNKQSKVTTAMLLSRIFSTKNIKNFISKNRENLNLPTLTEHLSRLCAEKGIKASAVVKNADMDRFYGADIFSGKRDNPSRDYIIRLAFGLSLNYDECQRLLTISRHSALYPRVPRDAVIISCLHNKRDFFQTEESLHELGFSSLRGNKDEKNRV